MQAVSHSLVDPPHCLHSQSWAFVLLSSRIIMLVLLQMPSPYHSTVFLGPTSSPMPLEILCLNMPKPFQLFLHIHLRLHLTNIHWAPTTCQALFKPGFRDTKTNKKNSVPSKNLTIKSSQQNNVLKSRRDEEHRGNVSSRL